MLANLGEMAVLFLPTPSARRATFAVLLVAFFGHISTHALREEGDLLTCSSILLQINFYPRPPRGGRPGPILL